jgi:predicted DNA-binding transcriptional regulator AlpA
MMTMQANQVVATGTQSVPVEEFINKSEVARRLKKTVRCVDNWMSRGILPYYKIGRSVAFKWSEIEAALARTCRVCRG